MQDRNLAGGALGTGGSWSIDLVSGNVKASLSYSNAELEGSASFMVKSKAGLEMLKELIPGKIDDAVISVVEAALGL